MITFRFWHDWLDMPKKSLEWHKADVADEVSELAEASRLFEKWSEVSDVVYTVTRARWSGHNLPFPMSKSHFFHGSLYMFPKYSLRWLFFKRAGRKAGATHKVTEVRNPKKTSKLELIANRNDINPEKFIAICKKQLRYWPLLK